jgi:hypothetical protein
MGNDRATRNWRPAVWGAGGDDGVIDDGGLAIDLDRMERQLEIGEPVALAARALRIAQPGAVYR